jgi:hypothetical protein
MVGQTYSASDILQTYPTAIVNPSYLISSGIQIGPGTDLLTKTAGGKPFSSFMYTTLFYGLKGNIKDIDPGYLWPGTQEIKTNVFPDIGTPLAFYRIQQQSILLGISCNLSVAPGTGTVTVTVRYTPILTPTITQNSDFTVTFGASDLVKNFYNRSLDLNTGDRIHVYVEFSGGNNNAAHDLTVQLDLF